MVIGMFHCHNSFRPHYGFGVDSASKRNEYQRSLPGGKSGRCVVLTILAPYCADYLEIPEKEKRKILNEK
jgi:hypothetical protein